MAESASENSEEFSFSEIIQALKDEQKPVPARYLYRFSGLEGDELEEFAQLWPGLSSQRRLSLLEDLELLAEANTLMNFDAIGRVGVEDEEYEVRVVAIRSLWQSERDDLIPLFLDILEKDPNRDVRAQAASALGRFVLLGELEKISPKRHKEIEDRLLAIMAEEKDTLIRRRALESLGYSSRKRIDGLIEDAYDYGDEDMQASALFAMGRSADPRWESQVIESLDDPDSELSKEAIRAAGELKLSEALPTLLNLLLEEESELRMTAAWALSQIGGKEVAEALVALQEQSENEDEIDLIEDAIENLAFAEELGEPTLLDFSEEDLEDLANPTRDEIPDSET